MSIKRKAAKFLAAWNWLEAQRSSIPPPGPSDVLLAAAKATRKAAKRLGKALAEKGIV